jgi:hypothetical protein
MYDYIVDNAQKNVWCTPNQDMQSITQPARITPVGGVWNTVPVQWRNITLPLQNTKFHVYQIGQINPLLMGLVDSFNQWITFAAASNKGKLVCDIYAGTGVQMPRYSCWYMITRDYNLIVAIQWQATIPIDLDTDPIFIRIYKNAFFRTTAANAVLDYTQTQGFTVLSTTDILTLQTNYLNFQNQITAGTINGQVYAFVNGQRVSGIDLFTAKAGDCVEFIYDSSIYKVVEFNISDLQTLVFTSSLDSKLKYLLHYPGTSDDQIDYQDDIDAFLYLPGSDPQGRWKGLFYIRNAVDAMRMVTHRDYAIPTAYVAAYATDNTIMGWTDPTQLVLRLHIRKGGWDRPLVFENNRIEELYKLSDAQIVAAMIGVNATLPNWQAATLEAAPYTQIMRSNLPQITNALVASAYGYNAVAKLIGDTPEATYTYSGQVIAQVPYGLQKNCTAYEYDTNGAWLGFYQHMLGSTYPAANNVAKWVEFIYGQGGNLLDETYGQTTVTLTPGTDYRFYTCPINQITGQPTYVWTDVTGTSAYTVTSDQAQATWAINPLETYTLVRGDTKHLAYELSVTPQGGVLEFTLMQQAVRQQQIQTIEMEIPMGELQLWLNGKALIEGIDYIVNFPQIVITNVPFLNQPAWTTAQNIGIRFTGFCNSDLTRSPVEDVGFVAWGRLSNNNKYDIRDDKVLGIYVGGDYFDRSQLLFAEDDPGITVPNATNCEPYQIRDIVVPMQNLVAEDTYAFRAESIVIDDAVSGYLTNMLPEVDPGTPNVIPQLWAAYSPFFSRIMNDLISGVFAPSFLTSQYSNQDVLNACQPYTWLLAFDQTQDQNPIDANYQIVLPHPQNQVITVSIYIYKFMSMVASLFLHNQVNMSHSINIAQIA